MSRSGLEPDLRWQTVVIDQSALAARVEGWTVCDAVPEPVADVLRVARMLLIDSYYEYSYSLVAVTWGLLATEASLKGCMPAKNHQADARTFGPLIDEAAGRKQGLITQDEAEVLRKAAELRNDIVHGHMQPKAPSQSYSPKDAMEMLKAIHEAISDLYSRAASG